MPALHRLSATQLKGLPPGKHCDGGGLWFHKRGDGGAQWVFRFKLHGPRRHMGLGGYPTVSLKRARELAAVAREKVAGGTDPLEQRRRERRQE